MLRDSQHRSIGRTQVAIPELAAVASHEPRLQVAANRPEWVTIVEPAPRRNFVGVDFPDLCQSLSESQSQDAEKILRPWLQEFPDASSSSSR